MVLIHIRHLCSICLRYWTEPDGSGVSQEHHHDHPDCVSPPPTAASGPPPALADRPDMVLPPRVPPKGTDDGQT